jgi:hypothetical protein
MESRFKVGDVVEGEPNEWSNFPMTGHEGKTYTITKVLENGRLFFDIDDLHDDNRSRIPSYWRLAKSHIINNILKEL